MSALSPEYIARCRPDLMRFATSRLGPSAVIEDVVQDTLLAALQNCDSFAGRSSPKTWLFGVLDHKIKDSIRWKVRSSAWASTMDEADDPSESVDGDHFSNQCPEQACYQRQFLANCDDCLRTLPRKQAQAFFLRECMDLDTLRVCVELQVSETNLNVILFRARQRLRSCLEARGFAPPRVPASPPLLQKK